MIHSTSNLILIKRESHILYSIKNNLSLLTTIILKKCKPLESLQCLSKKPPNKNRINLYGRI
jgi:hypothetical protein